MHNTPEQNEAFRRAWDATNARWKAQQKAFDADPVAYKAKFEEELKALKALSNPERLKP
jgi:hypothetical protein